MLISSSILSLTCITKRFAELELLSSQIIICLIKLQLGIVTSRIAFLFFVYSFMSHFLIFIVFYCIMNISEVYSWNIIMCMKIRLLLQKIFDHILHCYGKEIPKVEKWYFRWFTEHFMINKYEYQFQNNNGGVHLGHSIS